MFLFANTQKKISTPTAGFTLVELMVTVGIMLLITGMVVVKYSSFNSTVILTSQAYELALDIRSAQVYGVSAGGVTNSYKEAFGIYFDLTNPKQYILFQDNPLSGIQARYDEGEQVGEAYSIDPRFIIAEICTTTCSGSDTTQASIAFKRPNFDARMWSTIDSSPGKIKIVLQPADDPSVSRTITVYASGQISVQ